MRKIQVCSNKKPRPFSSGNNYGIDKIHQRILKKINSTEPHGQFGSNLAQYINDSRGFKALQIRNIRFSKRRTWLCPLVYNIMI